MPRGVKKVESDVQEVVLASVEEGSVISQGDGPFDIKITPPPKYSAIDYDLAKKELEDLVKCIDIRDRDHIDKVIKKAELLRIFTGDYHDSTHGLKLTLETYKAHYSKNLLESYRKTVEQLHTKLR